MEVKNRSRRQSTAKKSPVLPRSKKRTPASRKTTSNMDSILALSGGVDSVYCMYRYLKDNPEKMLIVHHVKMKNYEGRMEVEHKAVQKIIKWFRDNGMNNFNYIESGFDYGDIRFVNQDVITVGFVTGTILRNPKHKSIKNVIATTCYEERGGRNPSHVKRKLQTIRIAARRDDIVLSPMVLELGKGDMKDCLPKQLFDLCWYCRRPKNGVPCGKCMTCKRVAKETRNLDKDGKVINKVAGYPITLE